MLKLNNQGDTIVEVMISLAVLALAFAISYSTAQATLNNVQNSQEHSMALEYMDSQMEALHYVANETVPPVVQMTRTAFCLVPQNVPGGGAQIQPEDFTMANPGENPSNWTGSAVNCKQSQGSYNYYEAILPTSPNNYTVTIWWNGIGDLGKQSEQLSYRVYLQ